MDGNAYHLDSTARPLHQPQSSALPIHRRAVLAPRRRESAPLACIFAAVHPSRVGRNPQTGESIEISARRVLTFRPSQVLRAEVNASLEGKPISAEDLRKLREKDDNDDGDEAGADHGDES